MNSWERSSIVFYTEERRKILAQNRLFTWKTGDLIMREPYSQYRNSIEFNGLEKRETNCQGGEGIG